MKRMNFVLALFLLALALGAVWPRAAVDRAEGRSRSVSGARSAPSDPRTAVEYGNLPLAFEENLGQAAPGAKFVCRGSGASLALRPEQADLSLFRDDSASLLRLRLEGANPAAEAKAEDRQAGVSNYLVGHDPSQWTTGVPQFSKARFCGVYPGIDLVYYGNQGCLEFDFIVAPHADPGVISFQIDGAESTRVDEAGDLVIETPCGEVREHRPVVYQEADGARREVQASWLERANGRFAIEIASYDAGRTLVIDPVLTYCTGVGSSTSVSGIAVDSEGCAYVTGWVQANGLDMTSSAYQASCRGSYDAFVQKINPAGTALVYSTYLGGSAHEFGRGIAVDASGCAWVTGDTQSTDFPVTGPVYGASPSMAQEVFVTKLNPSGSALLVSTCLGGRYADGQQYQAASHAIALDAAGNAYVAGTTTGSVDPANPHYEGFPGSQQYAHFGMLGWGDAFVAKISPAGELLYDALIGGNDFDSATGIRVDAAGNAFIAGCTYSNDLSYTDAYDGFPPQDHRTYGNPHGRNAFVMELAASGSSIVYATVFSGSDGATYADGLALDTHGNVYVAGLTTCTDFPTLGALQGSFGGTNDAFVSKFGPDGAMAYSTYLGGASYDRAHAIAVDDAERAYVTGNTWLNGFPLEDNLNPDFTGGAFLTVIESDGASILYSTLLSNAIQDAGLAVAVDHDASAYVGGTGNPRVTPDAFDTHPWFSGFVAKVGQGAPTVLGRIEGTATIDGVLSAGVEVSLSGPRTAQATTDGEGRFRFDGLDLGAYTLTPASGDIAFAPAQASVTLTSDHSAVSDLAFAGTSPLGASIDGMVTLDWPSPARVRIALSGSAAAETEVNDLGQFAFPHVQPGTYTITPSLAGYTFLPASRTVTLGADDVHGQDFAGTTTFGLGGTVRLNGAPCAGAHVSAEGPTHAETTTDTEGRFELAGLPSGSYTVSAQLGDAALMQPVHVDVPPSRFDLVLDLELQYAVRGVVRMAGAPLAGQQVLLSGAVSSTATTDANGRFEFQNLPAGRYMVTAAADASHSGASRTLNVPPSRLNVHLNVRRRVTTSIGGVVRMPDGSARPHALVLVSGPSIAWAYSDGQGRFRFDNLPGGTYTVSAAAWTPRPNCRRRDRWFATQTVTVPPARTDLTLDLARRN